MEGTRQAVIAKVAQWIDGGSDRPICWLSGPAGSGKSAIAQTVAELCTKKNRLGASFFFLRGAGHRSDFTRFLRTLVYRLACFSSSARRHIQDVLKNDPLIVNGSFADQFQKLMIDPLPNLAFPLVIVIDALDECNDRESIGNLIQVLPSHSGRGDHIPYRFLMTSRVEEYIRSKFEVSGSQAHPATYALALQEYYAGADIRVYLRSRFAAIYQEKCRLMPNVQRPWPSEEVLDQLVQQSSGSFIFAATLVDFINDGSDLPHLKLRKALGTHNGLDPLYDQVFSDAQRSPHFEQVIGTIMLVAEPLSIKNLGFLLQVEAGHVLLALLGIQSALVVPEDDDQPVQLVHTSLRDFLVTCSRSQEWYIHPLIHHLRITIDCLKAIVEPEDGMFHVGFREYACLNWCHHLEQSLKEGEENQVIASLSGTTLVDCLVDVVSGFLDFWINTIILGLEYGGCVRILSLVLSRLTVGPFFCCAILQ
jgi:AAA ATPase domain